MSVKKLAAIAAVASLALVGCSSAAPATSPSAPSTPAASATPSCKTATKAEISALFDRWNDSLKTGDAKKVVANYGTDSLLLPTVSNKPRFSAAEKEDYFVHFLENKPVGKIDQNWTSSGCNTAIDSGLYTFTYGATGKSVAARYTFTYTWDGTQWLISSHHSSGMPEKAS